MIKLNEVSQSFLTYIDPGTTTMIIQVLIAGAIAGFFMLGIFWRKVKVFLIGLFKKRKDESKKRD